jgi:purine-cytosine permease-like protein
MELEYPDVREHLTSSDYRKITSLRFSAGTLGPVVFGLGLRDTCLTILFFNLICCAFPAYM